jgi:hypothetical protein
MKLRRLRLVQRSGTACVPLHNFASVDIGGAGSFGGQSTGFMDRGINVLALACHIAVTHRRQDGHIGKMAADVPGIATAWRNGGRVGHILRVIAAAGHLATGGELQQVSR